MQTSDPLAARPQCETLNYGVVMSYQIKAQIYTSRLALFLNIRLRMKLSLLLPEKHPTNDMHLIEVNYK